MNHPPSAHRTKCVKNSRSYPPLAANTKTNSPFITLFLPFLGVCFSLFFVVPSSTFCCVPIPVNLFVASLDHCCMVYSFQTMYCVIDMKNPKTTNISRVLYLRLNDGTDLKQSSYKHHTQVYAADLSLFRRFQKRSKYYKGYPISTTSHKTETVQIQRLTARGCISS